MPAKSGPIEHCWRRRISHLPGSVMGLFAELALVLVLVLVIVVDAAPFPAPDLNMCGWAYNTSEMCCTLPSSRSGSLIKKFELQHAHLPLRFRRAAHLLDDAFIDKYQRAVALMRALPETDGRSFTAQHRLHCAYCDNHLYYPGHQYPLEIHQSWLFLPWHRLFLFFHERILAKLIGDDSFALPFWNWDSQNATEPFPNQVPGAYYHNVSVMNATLTSSLWDPDRSLCSAPPRLVEFQEVIPCNPRPFPDQTRIQNAHLMWTSMVSVSATPLVMAGGIYRFGDYGARGMGGIEARPHGPVHGWTNYPDMRTFVIAASDPIFFALHGNIDRLWEVWKTLPGKYRGEVSDPDYLNTELTFYDDDGEQVSVTIKDFLDLNKIRVKYEDVANAWAENGAPQVNGDPSWVFCSSDPSEKAIFRLIRDTKRFNAPVIVPPQGAYPVTFKVSRRLKMDDSHGEEMLELRVAQFTWHKQHTTNLYAYLPDASYANTSIGCHEFIGNLQSFPHPGMSPDMSGYEFVFRIGIRRKLEMMGRAHLEELVVTIIGQSWLHSGSPGEFGMNLTSAKIIYVKE